MDAFRLGPMVLSAPRFYALLGLVALVVAAEVGSWLRRRAAVRRGATPDAREAAWAWNAALAVVIGARVGFVVENARVFAAAPLDAFAIWQGGFSPWWGVVAGALVAGWSFRRRWAEARAVAVPALVALAVWLGVPALLSPVASVAGTLPVLTVERLEGGTLDVAALEGRPTVVNLWATWCPPCRRELPLLADAQARHPELQFVFANQGEVRATVQAYLDGRPEVELENVVLDLGGQFGQAFDSLGLPTTLFFDAQGRHVLTHVGELSTAALFNYLTDLQRGTL